MVSITLSVTPELRTKMNQHDEINWSGYVRKCILKKAQELEWKERMLTQFEKEPTELAVRLQKEARSGRALELKKQGLL